MNTVLVTAFEPFGGEAVNPTELILKRLPDTIGDYHLKKLLLPVEFLRAPKLALAEYDRLSPAAVLMLGQAGGRSSVTPETAAKNVMNASAPDNAGYQPDHLPIAAAGADKLYSSFPAGTIIKAICAAGIPCERSDDAGQYVCNTLLYSMLAHNGGKAPTGFIHVPYIREQGHEDKPFLELDDLCKAVTAALETMVKDLRNGLSQADMKQYFESDRISFVEVSRLLINDYLIMVNDYENVNRFIGGMSKTFTEENEIVWVQKKLEEKAPVFSMIEKNSGKFIGNIELMDMTDTEGELGIALTAEMQNQGFGTEAVSSMIQYGFDHYGLKRIFLRTNPHNARAIRVYEKCGFTEYDRTEDHIFMEISG